MSDTEKEILFEQQGDWGIITLNRPRALNALNGPMVRAFRDQLNSWAGDDTVKAVMVRGAGEKAFCAGGDIRWLSETAKTDPGQATQFFADEYRNNAAIFHFPKPYVALINGIVMGGGVGVSVHGNYRIAGDRTLFAMPETGIGLFPDVGGGYFLPRLKDGLGLFYALTGARAGPADAVAAEIATHYVPGDDYAKAASDLLGADLGSDAAGGIDAVLARYSTQAPAAEIDLMRPHIVQLFDGFETLAALIANLKATDTDFARDIEQTLSRMSPTSLKLTFEQMKRGRQLSFDDVMRMELRMVKRVMERRDFHEGVRAVILDKDNKPSWSPAALGEVRDDAIASYFEPLGDLELDLP